MSPWAELVVALDVANAPKPVNNFVYLALHHYYDGVIFHRIINGFMCRRSSWHGYRFEDELPKPGRYEIGSVAMANAGPHTNRSQFLHRLMPSTGSPPLYSLFGKVVKGLDIVEQMRAATDSR